MQHRSTKTTLLTKKLGEFIKKERISKGYSCSKLAGEYEIDRGNLNRIENGLIDCKLITVWKIANALGLNFSDFIKMLEKELGKDFELIDE